MQAQEIIFKIAPFGSPLHSKTIELRYKVLREPLNLEFTKEQLDSESTQIHLAGVTQTPEAVIACCVLVPKNKSLKIRQVAVKETSRGQGLGSKLMLKAEEIAKEHNLEEVYCHARDYAKDFYLKLGYEIIGESFEEVGLKHWKMRKSVSYE